MKTTRRGFFGVLGIGAVSPIVPKILESPADEYTFTEYKRGFVIAVTAASTDDDFEEIMVSGAVPSLLKPDA